MCIIIQNYIGNKIIILANESLYFFRKLVEVAWLIKNVSS